MKNLQLFFLYFLFLPPTDKFKRNKNAVLHNISHDKIIEQEYLFTIFTISSANSIQTILDIKSTNLD